jgi:transcription-repair coupling factor (superfamily II helicase)
MSFIEEITSTLRESAKKINISGLVPASTAYLLSRLFSRVKRPFLVVAPTTSEAELLFEDLRFFMGDSGSLLFFPNLDVLPYFQLTPHPDVLTQRLGTLFEILQSRRPLLVITSQGAMMRRLPPRSIFNTYTDYVVAKEEIDREGLLLKLVEAGYLSVPLVEDPGSYSVRGGILDIYPPHSSHPYRIELFGDRVESIRLFEPSTQRSLTEVEELILLPAREIVLNEKTVAAAVSKIRGCFDEAGIPKAEREMILNPLKNRLPFAGLESFLPFFYESTAALFHYMKPETLLVRVDPSSAKDHGRRLLEEVREAREKATSPERIVGPDEIYLSEEEFQREAERFRGAEIYIQDPETASLPLRTETNELLRTKILPPSAGVNMLEPLVDLLREWGREGRRILFVAGSEAQKFRLTDLFARHELALQELPFAISKFLEMGDASFPSGGESFFVTVGHLSQGFRLADDPLLWITDEEIFGSKVRRIRRERPPSETFSVFEDLKEGDYVVHREHGIALYKGLSLLKLGEVEGEFLILEFLGSDKLYLPVYRLNLVQRYTGEEGQIPELDKLGGTRWAKTQEKVKKALRSMAGELLKIYATRATQIRKPFLVSGEMFEEFEASFPYEETPDQEKAIEDVLRDMEGEKPMDRLICGDVGFGKTEVALRAAFKAVLGGRQVTVLVPTTILAFQHFETFTSRLKPYGVSVEMLSRFRSPKEQKEILAALKRGEIDVLIGTHRLVQPDIHFKNLGLLIIDEEHRFGVAHKEKIKKMRTLVDVLTLTATPIPRTLNLSLFAIRDLTVINTPPADREAIRTYVAHFDEALIRDAILRELRRGGQVFFVHNRVQTIHAMAERLGRLVPEARITVAHGQMGDEELEEAMIRFLHKDANLLLSTAIIESGLDFPSANTILIHRADTFGLAQLYQLRGRVGRSNVRAFCYLFTPAEAGITSKARSRLSVLQRFTELGSGFKIAAHDLEIRGAGNILGAEQHGHIAAVGYEMYMRLLEETIAEVKGEQRPVEVDPELNFMIPAVLPEDYVSDPAIRLGLYKRIAHATDEERLEELKAELVDRFGPPPPPLQHLLALMNIRLLARRLLIESIHQERTRIIYKFHAQTPVPPDALIARMKKDPKHFQLTQDFQWITPQREVVDEKILEQVYRFLLGLEEDVSRISSS